MKKTVYFLILFLFISCKNDQLKNVDVSNRNREKIIKNDLDSDENRIIGTWKIDSVYKNNDVDVLLDYQAFKFTESNKFYSISKSKNGPEKTFFNGFFIVQKDTLMINIKELEQIDQATKLNIFLDSVNLILEGDFDPNPKTKNFAKFFFSKVG